MSKEKGKVIGDYVVEEKLGSGAFGAAYKVRSLKDTKQYVIKENLMTDEESKEMALQETNTLKSLNHKNVVKYIDSFSIGNKLYLVTEYCSGGDLYHLSQKFGKKLIRSFTEDTILSFFIQTCKGLSYIHEHNVIHRDLKTLNLFLTQNSDIKIGDFGLAKDIKTGYAKTFCGTEAYIAPELRRTKPLYGRKADIWSLGVIFYELCTFELPFDDAADMYKEKFKPLPKRTNKEIKRIISSMLKLDPEKRPYVEDILNDEFIVSKMKELKLNDPTTGTIIGWMINKELPEIIQSPDKEKKEEIKEDMKEDLKEEEMKEDVKTEGESKENKKVKRERKEPVQKVKLVKAKSNAKIIRTDEKIKKMNDQLKALKEKQKEMKKEEKEREKAEKEEAKKKAKLEKEKLKMEKAEEKKKLKGENKKEEKPIGYCDLCYDEMVDEDKGYKCIKEGIKGCKCSFCNEHKAKWFKV